MDGIQILNSLSKKATKIDITKLTRADFSSASLRSKYFRHDNRELDRLHLPAMTAEVYNEIAKTFSNARMDKANLKFETASNYYIRKAQTYVLATDLGVSPKQLDTSNYIWNEDYYIHSNFIINIQMVDDLFRERGFDQRTASSYTVYISQDHKANTLDIALWDELYKFCYKAIISRKAMLLQKVQQCLDLLSNVQTSSYGFTENVSAVQVNAMKSYAKFFAELLENKEAFEFIANTNDVKMFGSYEDTRKDYVETYRALLRRISGCSGEELEQFRKDLSFVEDPYIELILAKELDPEDFLSGTYLDNEDGEEESFEYAEI